MTLEEAKEWFEKERTLKEFNIPYDNIDDIEIMEEKNSYIYAKNLKTGELIFASLDRIVLDKIYLEDLLPTLYAATMKNNVVDEKFYCVASHSNHSFKKASDIRKYISRNNINDDENLIFRRAYSDTNIDGKDYCLVISNSGNKEYNHYKKASSSIALYHGHSNEIIGFGESIEHTCCMIFKNTRYEDNMYNFMLGHEFTNAKEHRWVYKDNNTNNDYLYACEKPSGVILNDGSVDILNDKFDSRNYFDYHLYHQINKINRENLISNQKLKAKAYFTLGYSSFLSIEKTNKKIKIKLLSDWQNDYVYKELFNFNIPSSDEKGFNEEEIDMIIEVLKAQIGINHFTYINKQLYDNFKEILDNLDLFTPVIRELNNYKSFIKNVDKVDFNFLSPYSLPIEDFDKTVEVLRNTNTNKLVEEIINTYIDKFDISKEELLGNDKEAKKWMQKTLEIKKQTKFKEPFRK